MKSMTGFGRSSNRRAESAEQTVPVELDVSIKAVNGRYLEVRFHIPREYAGLESELRASLSSYFSRGTVDVYVNRQFSSGAPVIQVNKDLARSWLNSYQELAETLKLQVKPNLEMLLRVPEIFQVAERQDVSEAEQKLLHNLLVQAAGACDRERVREGQALQSELLSLCGRLDALVNETEKLRQTANAELERRVTERLAEHLQKLGFEGKVDDQRLAQELVIYLDRADISEELTRLRAHLEAYRALLQADASIGKKLDFYAQELLREVNTIGSKSHVAKLTSLVVEAKTLVEKIREQVQNVE